MAIAGKRRVLEGWKLDGGGCSVREGLRCELVGVTVRVGVDNSGGIGSWKRGGTRKRVNACAILLERGTTRLCEAVCTRRSHVSQLPVSLVESFRAY